MPGTIARALLPAPLTLVLPNPARRFQWLSGAGRTRSAFACPSSTGDTRAIVRRVGAVAATSANLTGGPDPKSARRGAGGDSRGRGGRHRRGRAARNPLDSRRPDRPEPQILREGALPAAEVLERLDQLA